MDSNEDNGDNVDAVAGNLFFCFLLLLLALYYYQPIFAYFLVVGGTGGSEETHADTGRTYKLHTERP